MQFTSQRIIKYSLLIIGLGTILIVPDKLLFHSDKSLCLHLSVTGVKCPLCGMTRAIHEVFHIRILSALRYNMLVPLLFLVIALEIYIDFINPESIVKNARRFLWIFTLAAFGMLYLVRIGIYLGWWNWLDHSLVF
jgi:hypothetical protein